MKEGEGACVVSELAKKGDGVCLLLLIEVTKLSKEGKACQDAHTSSAAAQKRKEGDAYCTRELQSSR